MRIYHNIPALNAWRNSVSISGQMAKSLEKLSTGLRINRAADDAAGLAISEKMRAQVRGLSQAMRNAQDGISMIQTAEGGLNETHSILQRMRELSVQAANDTYTSQDRAEIQKEVNQLVEEIDRISATTEFNNKKLLDGTTSALVSSDKLTTQIFMRDGLRVLDQFGQKAPGGGNYRLNITAEAGVNEVQKTDIFKIKHEGSAVAVDRIEGGVVGTTGADTVWAIDFSNKDGAGSGDFTISYDVDGATYTTDPIEFTGGFTATFQDNIATALAAAYTPGGANVSATGTNLENMTFRFMGALENTNVQNLVLASGTLSIDATQGVAYLQSAGIEGDEERFEIGVDPGTAATFEIGTAGGSLVVSIQAVGYGVNSTVDVTFDSAAESYTYSASTGFAFTFTAGTSASAIVSFVQEAFNTELGAGNYVVSNTGTDGWGSSASATVSAITEGAILIQAVSSSATALQVVFMDGAVQDAYMQTGTNTLVVVSDGTEALSALASRVQTELGNNFAAGAYSVTITGATSALFTLVGTESQISQQVEAYNPLDNEAITITRDTPGVVDPAVTIELLSGVSTSFFNTNSFTLVVGLGTSGATWDATALATRIQSELNSVSSLITAYTVTGKADRTFISGVSHQTADVEGGTDALVSPTQDVTGGPVEAVNERQRVTVEGATGGTFKLSFNDEKSGEIAYNASIADVQAALEVVGTIGAGNVDVSGSAGNWTIEFINDMAGDPHDLIEIIGGGLEKAPGSIGDIATESTKLYDIDRFWDASGNFILETPQTITLVQGDGKQATFTLSEADTIGDVSQKLNEAIGIGLGQLGIFDLDPDADTDRFVSYVTEPDASGLEALEGTFVIRSAIAGNEGKITFVGDDNTINALSLTTIQNARNNYFTVNVTEVHSGSVVAENVRLSENKLVGIVHQNVDVQFGSNEGVLVEWDETANNFSFTGGSANATATFVHLADRTNVYHIGANQKQDIGMGIGNMGSKSLGIFDIQVSSNPLANQAIGRLDNAIGMVSSERSKLGALQNRLEHTINNLGVTMENLTAAESRIRDADMAWEIMNFTKQQILLQSANAMLAQANQLPQNVLQLLR